MRKRIVIGLLVVVVIGVGAFFVSQPKRGSVEWHRREYLAALNQPRLSPIKGIYYNYKKEAGVPPLPRAYDVVAQMDRHWWALQSLGFIRSVTIFLTNRTSDQVFKSLPERLASAPKDHQVFTDIGLGSENGRHVIRVSAPAQDIVKWEGLIREADVAESGLK